MDRSIDEAGRNETTSFKRRSRLRTMGQCAFAKLSPSSLLRLLCWTILVLHNSASCQTASTGALIGEVLDPSGRGIPNAAVEAKNQETAVSRSTVSDEDGHFAFPLLPPGTYQVEVVKAGYAQAQSNSVQ